MVCQWAIKKRISVPTLMITKQQYFGIEIITKNEKKSVAEKFPSKTSAQIIYFSHNLNILLHKNLNHSCLHIMKPRIAVLPYFYPCQTIVSCLECFPVSNKQLVISTDNEVKANRFFHKTNSQRNILLADNRSRNSFLTCLKISFGQKLGQLFFPLEKFGELRENLFALAKVILQILLVA